MSENKLKAGLIGYGLAGKVFHAPLLAGSGFELTSILTNNPDRIASAKSDFPNAHIAEDMKQLLDQDLDLVVVASANVVHAEQALQVIAAGITVVIDKPVGRNVRETHSIFDAADNAGVKACAFFNRRWDSDALTMKRVIKTREIGSIHRFESRFERFRPEINMDSWREDSAVEQGGGLLLDLQTHLIAGAIDLFGPAEVSYCSMRKIRGGSEDDCVIVLKHLMNVDSYLSVSAVAGGPGSRVRALGKTGAVEIDHLDPQEDLLKSGAKPVNGKWEIGPKSTGRIMRGDDVEELEVEAGNYPAFYNQVAEAIRGNGDMPVPVADAMEVARLIDVAREMSIR